jgi:hypothetical protein
MSAQDIAHDGYTITIARHGPGWRAFVYPPGDRRFDIGIRHSMDSGARDRVIAAAKALAADHRAGRLHNGGTQEV